MSSISIIFPGQGSQYVGMGQGLYQNFKPAKDIFDKADDLLGFKISQICFNGPEDKLKDTYYQQLAIFLVSAACFDIFSQELSIKPSYAAGLSLGEYACLYACKVLDLEGCLKLIEKRAKAMQEAALDVDSTMLAVLGLGFEEIKEADGDLFYIANLNCPAQVVVSLLKVNQEKAEEYFRQKGAKSTIELKVSGGFHSPFMDKAKIPLADAASSMNFKDADIPLISNVDAQPHTKGKDIKDNIILQLTRPVLWQKSVEFIKFQGINTFCEIGPSTVLKGILRKIDRELKVFNFDKLEDFQRKELL